MHGVEGRRIRKICGIGSCQRKAMRGRWRRSSWSAYVVTVRQRRERKGQITPGPQHSHTPRKSAGLETAIAGYAAEHADATIEEFRAWLQAAHATYASAGLMGTHSTALG